MRSLPSAAFVYGTLMPGHLRWPWLAEHVVRHRPAQVRGHLYDTGLGFPAAVFAETGTITGVWCELRAERVADAWELLDEVEGRLYVRRAVTTLDGAGAGSYEWAGTTQGLARLEGVWRGE